MTYGVSGVLLALSGYLFSIGVLTAQTQTIAWMVIFFFAGGECRLSHRQREHAEVRAAGDCAVLRDRHRHSHLFGALIDTGSRNSVFAGYLLRLGIDDGPAAVAWRYAVAAERKSLEVARPLWSRMR